MADLPKPSSLYVSARDGTKTALTWVGKPFKWTGGKLRGLTGGANSVAGGVVMGTLSAFKKPLIAVGVLGGIAGLGALALSSRKEGARAAANDIADAEAGILPPVMQPEAMMAAQQPTLMGQPLVEGQHANRVMMGRGGMAPQAGIGQPEQSIVPAEQVQSLGRNA